MTAAEEAIIRAVQARQPLMVLGIRYVPETQRPPTMVPRDPDYGYQDPHQRLDDVLMLCLLGLYLAGLGVYLWGVLTGRW